MAASARSRRCCAAMRFSDSFSRLVCAALQETLFRFCIFRRRKRFFPHRVAASPSVHRIPLGALRRFSAPPRRSPLSLGRFAMTCTAASLSYADKCVAFLLAFSRISPLPPSPQWFASTFPHCTYCRCKCFVRIASPPAHQLIAFLGRIAPIFHTAASFTAFAGAVRNDLHRRVTQLR